MRTQLKLYQSVIKWGVETGKHILGSTFSYKSSKRLKNFCENLFVLKFTKILRPCHFEIIKDILEVMQKCPVSQVYTNAMSINNQHLILQ